MDETKELKKPGIRAFDAVVMIGALKVLVEYRTDRSAVRLTVEGGEEQYVPLDAYIVDQNSFELWIEAFKYGISSGIFNRPFKMGAPSKPLEEMKGIN